MPGLSSSRSLTEADLAADGAGAWAPRAGMSAISTARTRLPSGGARAIMDAFGDLDDVGDHSGFAADPSVALVTAADSAMRPRRRR